MRFYVSEYEFNDEVWVEEVLTEEEYAIRWRDRGLGVDRKWYCVEIPDESDKDRYPRWLRG